MANWTFEVFQTQNVLDVCVAVLEQWFEYNNNGWGYCRHCMKEQTNIGETGVGEHKPDCVVLTAKDMLTGFNVDVEYPTIG